MHPIQHILNTYSQKLDRLDLELIIAHAIKKSREFILTHPEYEIKKNQLQIIHSLLHRRIKCEPLAYIFGEKEFHGMKYKVRSDVLIPRPETELLVEKILEADPKNKIIIDVGTGSGNIIITIAKKLKEKNIFYGIDISKKALGIAKQNAKINRVEKKIKFLHGNLLEPIKKLPGFNSQHSNLIIAANLPYLSPKIYSSCSQDIKRYEPKSALISQKEGLCHYDKLMGQLIELEEKIYKLQIFLEISPEQKTKLPKIIKKYFSRSKINFHKDLSGRWRLCEIKTKI